MKLKKRVLASLLAATLLVSIFAGCTKNAGGGKVDPSKLEEVTVSLYGPPTGFALVDGIQEDAVSKELARATGVTIDFYAHPDAASFNALIASNDLPDIMCLNANGGETAKLQLEKLIDAKMITPLEELMDYAPNLKAMPDFLDFNKKAYGGEEKKLYTVQGYLSPAAEAGGKSAKDTGIGPVLRYDYYKEMGFPAIKSGDDWLDIVEKMLKAHPTNENGEKRYGFSPMFEWGMSAVFGHYGMIVESIEGGAWPVYGKGGQLILNAKERTFTDGITDKDSTLWGGVKFITKAYQRGLIDPDVFTNKWDTVIAKTTADRVLSSSWTWGYGDINTRLDPVGSTNGTRYAIVPAMTAFGGVDQAFGTPDRLWVISAKSEHKEACMRYIDYLYSHEGARTIYSGVKGVHYIEKDGKLIVPKEIDEAAFADPAKATAENGLGVFNNYAGFCMNYIDPKYGQRADLRSPGDREYAPEKTSFEVDFCKQFGTETVELLYESYSLPGVAFADMKSPSEEIKEIDKDIAQYLEVELPNLITSKEDTEFKKNQQRIIDECMKKGHQKSIDFWTAELTEVLKNVANYE